MFGVRCDGEFGFRDAYQGVEGFGFDREDLGDHVVRDAGITQPQRLRIRQR